MVEFYLKSQDDTKAVYEYFVEGKGKPGTVAIDKADGKKEIVQLSPDDWSRNYACKALTRMKEYQEANSYKEHGMVAWY